MVPVYYRRFQDGDVVREFKIRVSAITFQKRLARLERIASKWHGLNDSLENLGSGIVERSLIPAGRDAAVVVRWNHVTQTMALTREVLKMVSIPPVIR